METLLDLQKLELQNTARTAERKAQIEALRRKIPEAVLLYFDRWIGRGKKPIAIARGGVCCECHLKIAVGVLGELAMGEKLESCGNCGRLLYLPGDEALDNQSAAIPPKPARPACRTDRRPKSGKNTGLKPGDSALAHVC